MIHGDDARKPATFPFELAMKYARYGTGAVGESSKVKSQKSKVKSQVKSQKSKVDA